MATKCWVCKEEPGGREKLLGINGYQIVCEECALVWDELGNG